jgi:uncharacterized protein YoxC
VPDNFLAVDAAMPNFDSARALPERVEELQNYVFQLLEQLRYLFNNIDPTKNFNPAALASFISNITTPIVARITDAEDRFTTKLDLMAEGLNLRITDAVKGLNTEITATAEGLRTEVQDAVKGLQTEITQTAGAIRTELSDAVTGLQTEITATADGLQTQVSTLKGNISTLTQTAEGLQTQVTTQKGQISTVTQTAEGLSTRVATAEGNISTVTQTADYLVSQISGIGGAFSSINQRINSITISVTEASDGQSSTIALYKDGIVIASERIVMSGLVTFEDLSTSDGKTEINGNNIKTGKISADLIAVENITSIGAANKTLTIESSNLIFKGNQLVINGGQVYLPIESQVHVTAYSGGLADFVRSVSSASVPSHTHSFLKDGSSTYSQINYKDGSGTTATLKINYST